MNRKTLLLLMALVGAWIGSFAIAQEHDYYRYVRQPTNPLPGVGRNKVEQEGAPKSGYQRRTVQWWPRKGQDIIDIPKGVPLRTWTRNTGEGDPEALEGISRVWKASSPKTFKAHLVGFRGYGTSTRETRNQFMPTPIAILRMEDGTQRGVHNASLYSKMISSEDSDFIHAKWEQAFPKLYATTLQDEALTKKGSAPGGDVGNFEMKHWTAARPKFNAIIGPMNKTYPRWGRNGYRLAFETPHFFIIAQPDIWGGPWGTPAHWIQPDNFERETQYRKGAMESIENLWTYTEACGGSMPYWRWPGPNYRFIIHSHRNRAAGGSMHCGISDVDRAGIGHEFFHSMPAGGWDGMYYETWSNSGQHITSPGEFQMFPGNFCFPWRNVNRMHYQSSFWAFALGDNPNWGHGAPVSVASLAGEAEPTPYHTVARLGEKKGLWKNGIKGWGDWWGEYAARMVTVDTIEKNIVGRYGMPNVSCVYPVYGHENRYRISNAESPRFCGYNIIRLEPDKGAKEITIDFQGLYESALHSDWRACIVAVDAEGRPRYSRLWNKGKLSFALKPADTHLWLTVSASPSAFPILGKQSHSWSKSFLTGIHAPRYPWEVTLTGCTPGAPHRRQGDVQSFDHLSGISDYGNKFLDIPVGQEAPIPLTDRHGKLAYEKLPALRTRIQAATKAVDVEGLPGGVWWRNRKVGILKDMARRAKFLQDNAKGHRHPNGGGFIAGGARVAKTAYVGPDAMVLDGARVEDNACIKGHAIVRGPKTVVSGHAKIGGRSHLFGDIHVSGNARILDASTVTTTKRGRYGDIVGRAKIEGNAVIKGDPIVWLCGEELTLTGGAVVDYVSFLDTRTTGVCDHGRFCTESWRGPIALSGGEPAGELFANWQFNQPKGATLEDSYVNNDGILYGQPKFDDSGEHKCIVFNGKDQYAEAPPTVADFGELTLDLRINRAGGKRERLFDFGTGKDDCFYLDIVDPKGTLALEARHGGKTCKLTTSAGIPANTWVTVRIEINGKTASIYLDNKQVATGPFPFHPRDVFVGDRPEGNFIATSRDKDHFFKGRIDHFRIYRTVHKDFDNVGPAPFALTQLQEWSEETQARADAWEARRKVKEAEIHTGRYAELQAEIKRIDQQRRELHRNPKQKELDARFQKARQALNVLDQKIRTESQALSGKAEIQERQKKINAILQEIQQVPAYVKLTQQIQACREERQKMEQAIGSIPALKAIQAKMDQANQAKLDAEERIKQLPDVKKAMARCEQEKEKQKKKQWQDQYNRLLAAKMQTDLKRQTALVISQRFKRQYQDAARKARDVIRRKTAKKERGLREKQRALMTKRRGSHAELSKLEESVTEEQARARAFVAKARASQDYKKAQAAPAAARKAMREESNRFREERKPGYDKLSARIRALQKEATALRNNALRNAHLLGQNPHPSVKQAELHNFQKSLIYHTKADWDYRIAEEINGTAPQKMKDWLERTRGY